jgi:hypothetical protein
MPLIHTEETIAGANRLMEERIYGGHTFKEVMKMSKNQVNQLFADLHQVPAVRTMTKQSALTNILINRVVFHYNRNRDIPLDERNQILLKMDYIERFVLKSRNVENRGMITGPRVWVEPEPEPEPNELRKLPGDFD